MGNKISTVLACFVITAFSLCACGAKADSWAYVHEPEKEILSLSDNGKAVYKGSNYKYTKDDSFITLKDDSDKELKLRYVQEVPEKMVLYEKLKLNYQGEGSPENVIGAWVDDNGRSSFQFTEKGTFAEDNIFYGHFNVDEGAKTIKLMYDEPLEDTVIYYELDGNTLTIDYPWALVHTGSDLGGPVDEGTIK